MIITAAIAAGDDPTKLPCAISKVDPAEHLQFEWRAFRALSSDRQVGMAAGPVLWSSIDRFAQRYNVDGDDFDRFTAIIQAMDEAYRDYSKGKP